MASSNPTRSNDQSYSKRSKNFKNNKQIQKSKEQHYYTTNYPPNTCYTFQYENSANYNGRTLSSENFDMNINLPCNSRSNIDIKPYQNRSTNLSNFKLNRRDFPKHQHQKTENFVYTPVANVSTRGKIIEGRYVRNHSNTSLNDKSVLANSMTETPQFFNKYSSKHTSFENSPPNSSRENVCNKRNVNCECHVSTKNDCHSKTYSKRNGTYFSANKNHNTNLNQGRTYSKETYKRVFCKSASYHDDDDDDDDDKATQRELLIHHLKKGVCECLVCCELIGTKDPIWNCLSCYHILHLKCIKKWARSPAASVEDGSWRCPACQNLNSKVPFDYYCFCKKHKNPEINYHLTPHSCGEICDRVRSECVHRCKELCHPGPCPPCAVVVQKTCPCGKTQKTVPCNQRDEVKCQEICGKILNCGLHSCQSICHKGSCSPCEKIVVQSCYCGKREQNIPCTSDTAFKDFFSCENVCNKKLNCGHHFCKETCHLSACQPCHLLPDVVKKCCCGKTEISQLVSAGKVRERLTCEDPLPVCDLVCGKPLQCGPKDDPHTCQSLCHERDCLPCKLTTSVKCSCGAFTKEFSCTELTPAFIYTCEKRCNRRKECGRHKCLKKCCTNLEHKCELVCNKKLSCGLHLCQETCHMGNCPTCWNVSFDELRCHCGAAVLYPPIHCGTKPPECSEPCTRVHSCDHDVKHSCHSDDKCPPCTSLVTKWCYGKHKQCGPLMCFLDGISCGMPCQKPLPCGKHVCKLTCHPGECLKESEKCLQPCTDLRPSCAHPCGNRCHKGPCLDTPCKAQVVLTCPCGHRSETTTCFDSAKSYRLMSSTILATKMQEIKEGQCVNLNDVLGKKSKNNKLQCNEECAVIERNKRLAVALQIQNPDLSCTPGAPCYSEFLKDEAKKNPQLVSDIYEKISDLVQLAKQSKQKCRSHSFPPMKRDHRRIVHELAEFFGCETQSYDEEPKKNVVVTAYKNKCWLPFTHIMTVVQRDMGIRKGPTPVLSQRDPKSSSNGASSTNQKKIDYFDYND